MRAFFDPRQLRHAPEAEFFGGALVPHVELPRRAEAIAATLGSCEPPVDHGEAPIRRVHDWAYVDFLKRAATEWEALGREGGAIGYVWPVGAPDPPPSASLDLLLGRYSFDTTTPITPHAWEASYWSAQCALSALDAVLGGERAAFALCRPPGHHAGRAMLGGYCYLNHAAIAAQAARDAGVERVAILDIDYHHGNGTQEIFWSRGDVFYASVHADPAHDYPYHWGHAGERGEGEGIGTTLNLPLPQGTALEEFRAAQAQALDAIDGFDPGLLVLSFGADTFGGDPIARFGIFTRDYATLGADIAARGRRCVIVMEGGYASDALGPNVASLLSGF